MFAIGTKIRLTTHIDTNTRGISLPPGATGIVTGNQEKHKGFWASFILSEKDPAPVTLVVFPDECEEVK